MCFKLISQKKVAKCNCQITITEQSTKISTFESQIVLIQNENQKFKEENEKQKSQLKVQEQQLQEFQSKGKEGDSRLKNENEELKNQVKHLEQQLQQPKSKENDVNSQFQEENKKLISQIKTLEQQLTELQSKYKESESKLKESESKLKEENENLKGQIKNLEKQLKDQHSQNMNQSNLKSQEETEALKSQIKNLEKQLAESQSKQIDIESKRKQENEQFQQLIKSLEQQLKDLQSKDEETKQLKLKLQDIKEKYQTLIQTNEVLIEENEYQLTQINTLNQQITQINIQIQQCTEIHLKAEQHDALLVQIEDLKKQLEIAVKDQNLRQALEDMQKKLSLAEEQANERQQWEEEAEEWKQRCQEMEQKSNEFDETVQKLLKEQENTRKLSYQLEEFKEKMTEQDKSQEPIATKIPEESKVLDEIDNVDIENFEQDLQRLKEKTIKENDLLKQISKYKGEKPMLYVNIWKIFETLMDKKYENDMKDLEAGIAPRPMTQFMLDYLIMTYGVKSLAQKTLAQLLLGLQQLYQEKHIYGNLFCRFLQVYNPNPIDAVLATFLVQARNEFQKLIQAYASQKKGAEKPKQPNKTWGWDMIDVTSVGGNAPMMDLFELIQKFFESDKELGQNIMMRLIPDEQYKAEFYLLVLVFKIKKTGKSPLEIYQLIDQNKDGKLQISDFIKGMKTSLDLKLNEEEIACIINELDIDKTGDVSQSEFVERIAFLQQKYKNKDAWLCSKAQFLTAISDEYDAKRIRDFNQLKEVFSKFDEDGNGSLEFREFEKLCKSLDANIQQSRLADMFNFALKITKNQDPDVMSPQAFAFTAQRFNLGGFGTGIFNASAVLSAVSREEEDTSLEKGKVKIVGKKPPQTRSRIAQKAK